MRAVPALGLLAALRSEHRNSGATGTDRRRPGTRPAVRRLHQRLPETLQQSCANESSLYRQKPVGFQRIARISTVATYVFVVGRRRQ